MYKRYLKMVELFGWFAGYLLVKVETKTLTIEDVGWAESEPRSTSKMIRTVYDALEGNRDFSSVAEEAMNGIIVDLHLDPEPYLAEMGIMVVADPWGPEGEL